MIESFLQPEGYCLGNRLRSGNWTDIMILLGVAMIERYEVPEISKIWTEENKFRKWLDVELAITETWAEMGEVPKKSLENIRKLW